MKRLAAIIGILAFALGISFVSYIKGHSDGAREASVSGLIFDTIVFDDMEKHGLVRAKSRLGMFITLRYDTLNSESSWMKSWLEWTKVDTESNLDHRSDRAKQISEQYREGIPTLTGLKNSLEEAYPDVNVEFKTD